MNKITISRLDTDIGTFRVSANLIQTRLVFTGVEILGSDGWEALIIDPQNLWYKTLLVACKTHLTSQNSDLP